MNYYSSSDLSCLGRNIPQSNSTKSFASVAIFGDFMSVIFSKQAVTLHSLNLT